MAQNEFNRQVAIKITIEDILQSKFIQGDNDNPSHFKYKDQDVYRINVMGIILNKEKIGSITNIMFDDGTSNITLRLFEENNKIDLLVVGDAILIVGKLRIYNQQKYISPEIIKKIDKSWLKVRLLELNKNNIIINKENLSNEIINENDIEIKEINENLDEPFIEEFNENILPIEKLLNIIKTMDQGNGVLIEDIIDKSPLENTEELLEKMLENGDIFQNQPGKVKVL